MISVVLFFILLINKLLAIGFDLQINITIILIIHNNPITPDGSFVPCSMISNVAFVITFSSLFSFEMIFPSLSLVTKYVTSFSPFFPFCTTLDVPFSNSLFF